MTTQDELLAKLLADPEWRESFEDAEALASLRSELVQRRSELKVTQKEVARRMGVGQSTVSEFENSANDPRVSTLQRYARAVAARLVLQVNEPRSAAWANTSVAVRSAATYNILPPVTAPEVRVLHEGGVVAQVQAWIGAVGADAARTDFELIA